MQAILILQQSQPIFILPRSSGVVGEPGCMGRYGSPCGATSTGTSRPIIMASFAGSGCALAAASCAACRCALGDCATARCCWGGAGRSGGVAGRLPMMTSLAGIPAGGREAVWGGGGCVAGWRGCVPGCCLGVRGPGAGRWPCGGAALWGAASGGLGSRGTGGGIDAERCPCAGVRRSSPVCTLKGGTLAVL